MTARSASARLDLARWIGAGALLVLSLGLAGSAAAQDGLELAPPELGSDEPAPTDGLQLEPANPSAQAGPARSVDEILDGWDDEGQEEDEESWLPDEEAEADPALEAGGLEALDEGADGEFDGYEGEHGDGEHADAEGEHGEGEHGEGEHAEGAHGAGADHGAEGEHHEEAHFDLTAFIATLVNFIIWLALVVWLGRKPVSEYLKARRVSVEEGMVEAQRLGEQAKKQYDKYSKQLDHLDQELARMREEMIAAGEAERDRIIEEAEARAARMRKETAFVLEQRVKQLRTDLTREAIEAAVAAAEEVLVGQIASGDQQGLADEYLEGLSGALAEAKEEDEVRA